MYSDDTGQNEARGVRSVPDVAADANGHTGMSMLLRNGGWSMLRDAGGTSASAVTGWGSPDAQVLVPLLARYATP